MLYNSQSAQHCQNNSVNSFMYFVAGIYCKVKFIKHLIDKQKQSETISLPEVVHGKGEEKLHLWQLKVR